MSDIHHVAHAAKTAHAANVVGAAHADGAAHAVIAGLTRNPCDVNAVNASNAVIAAPEQVRGCSTRNPRVPKLVQDFSTSAAWIPGQARDDSRGSDSRGSDSRGAVVREECATLLPA